MDVAGKDSAIKHVMSGINPQLPSLQFQTSECRGTGARLFVERDAEAARTGPDWHLQSLLLRGSADRSRTSRDSRRRGVSRMGFSIEIQFGATDIAPS